MSLVEATCGLREVSLELRGVNWDLGEVIWELQAGDLAVRDVIYSNIIPLMRDERS